MSSMRNLFAASLLAFAAASPAPTARNIRAREAAPVPTGSPVQWDPTKTYKNRRDIIDDIQSDVNGVLSRLGSDIPSYVASGIPNFFQDFPTGDKVVSSLGLDDDQLAALPTQALNIPPYANFSDGAWNVRFHGNIYKQPNTSTEQLNDLANVFLIDTSVEDLPQNQADQARNVTAAIFVVQQGNVNVSPISIEPFDGDHGGVGVAQQVTLPYETTDQGDFDVFLPINSEGLARGNETQSLQKINTWVGNTTNGNATAYLVPDQGLTIISDIDDILRITKIYDPKEGLLNSFARPFVAWENMPEIYANWSQSLPDAHFHYLTTLPEQVTRNYEEFIYNTYPAGSFDTRPLNFSDISATLAIREFLLVKIFETFPQRKFVLVADTSNSDVMKDYPMMAKNYPDQVQCIFLRNTSATDDSDHFPYDTSGFEGIDQNKYMFFVHADDLKGINIAGDSNCYNQSVPQNLTFGYQGLPFGIGNDAAVNGSANDTSAGIESATASTGLTFFAFIGLMFWQFL
ncbi:Putative phosphatidate phosphatase APP1, catalytic domain-containing protein [Septoria linicola]|uniref:Phosphatidate phosphatase APP1, catalytic domain-containing protein n=1 Tax=Septoria linicola TaxID=215465 RepID=A0A9Q9ENA3_9PEZI|nr:Putative phosphatidate phosphatase APP1, catalytic domain-containing protein [Septoria linicola]